ncbi:MAG: DsrE family protein [Bacteroidetes bacterium]|nr:DsrE family protein [Bacteroidota bacterium]
MKKIKLLFVVVLINTFSSFAQTSASGKTEISGSKTAQHRVIMQLVSGDTLAHKALISQLKNLKEVWADSVEIEVLIQGPALDMIIADKTTQQEGISKMKQKGVRFIACEFSMRQRKVTKEELLKDVESVNYGLVEIITKQEQGWSYLKAGF